MDSGLAETYLRLLAEAELRRASSPAAPRETWSADWPGAGRVTQPGSGAALASAAAVAAGLGDDLPPGEVTRLVGSVLAVAGAVDHAAAAAVAGNLDAALAARHLSQEGNGRRQRQPGWPLLVPGRAAAPAPGEPAAGQLRVVPLTAQLPVRVSGQPVRLDLLAYAQAPAVAIFTGAARSSISDPAGELLIFPAADDQGRRCQLVIQLPDSGEALWEGQLTPPPGPGPGPRWLEITTGTGQGTVRVDLGAPGSRAAAIREQVAARSAGELLADAAADGLLAAALMPVPGYSAAKAEAAGIGSVLTACLALGLLPAGSSAFRRLTALCQRLGTGASAQVPGLTGVSTDLPECEEAALADRMRRDGPRAVARLAAALPAIDGTRIALTALESMPDRAALHLLALGWDPPSPELRAFSGAGDPPLSWQAQDNTGRWHTASGGSWSSHGHQQWSGLLQLRPPLHPAATALELTITGKTGRQHMTLPLRWVTEDRS